MEKVNINLVPSGVMPSCHASQNDKTRTVRFYLKSESSDITLAGTEVIKCKVTKPNGASATIDVTNTSSNYVDVDFTSSELDVSGSALCELSVDGIGSLNFVLRIEEDAYNGANIEIRTASGEIATFTTNISDNLIACKSQIVAIESGTGQKSPTNPYTVTGFNGATIVRCGKNFLKYPYAETTKTINNVTFTDNGNGSITINSTGASATTYFNMVLQVAPIFFKKGTYTVNQVYTSNDIQFNIYKADGTAISTGYSKRTFTLNEDTYIYYFLRINSGAIINNITVYLQIERGNTDTTYEIYKGSKYQFYFEGLLNGTYGFVDLGTLNYEKYDVTQGTLFRTSTINNCNLPYNSLDLICSKYATALSSARDNLTVSVGSGGTGKVDIIDNNYSDTTTFKNAMNGVYLIYKLATPTTPTITQEEIDTLISAFGDDLVCVVFGQTVYGGVLDVTTGKLTITHGVETDMSQLSWSSYASAPSCTYAATITDKANGLSNFICSHYERYEGTLATLPDLSIRGQGSANIIYLRDTNYATASDLTNALSGAQLVYKLATPLEYDLSSGINIPTLNGKNNIFSDTGDILVKFLLTIGKAISE